MKIRWVAVCIRLGLEKVPDTFLSLLVEMDQAIFNRNDFIGVTIAAVLLQKRVPTIKILPVEKWPESAFRLQGDLDRLVGDNLRRGCNGDNQSQKTKNRQKMRRAGSAIA